MEKQRKKIELVLHSKMEDGHIGRPRVYVHKVSVALFLLTVGILLVSLGIANIAVAGSFNEEFALGLIWCFTGFWSAGTSITMFYNRFL